MKVKFITCIFSDLYGTEFGGRTGRKDHYRMSLLSLLKMTNADFICYTSDREIDDLKNYFYVQNNIPEEKLKLEIFDLENSKYSTIINEFKDKELMKKTDRCYEIQFSKFYFFSKEDKTYDYYFWIDAGLSHTGIIPDKYLKGPGYRCYFESELFNNNFLNNLLSFCEDKFLFLKKENQRNYWSGTVNPKFYNNFDMSYHVIGGLFGGKKETWDEVIRLFDEYLFDIIKEEKRLYFEENIMSLMYYNHTELFKSLYFDVWWHEDNYKDSPKNFFTENKSFYKILEELN